MLRKVYGNILEYICDNCGNSFTRLKKERDYIAPHFCHPDCKKAWLGVEPRKKLTMSDKIRYKKLTGKEI